MPVENQIKLPLLQGWDKSQLDMLEGQWVIYSNTRKSYVPLLRATPELLELCPDAKQKVEEIGNENF